MGRAIDRGVDGFGGIRNGAFERGLHGKGGLQLPHGSADGSELTDQIIDGYSGVRHGGTFPKAESSPLHTGVKSRLLFTSATKAGVRAF